MLGGAEPPGGRSPLGRVSAWPRTPSETSYKPQAPFAWRVSSPGKIDWLPQKYTVSRSGEPPMVNGRFIVPNGGCGSAISGRLSHSTGSDSSAYPRKTPPVPPSVLKTGTSWVQGNSELQKTLSKSGE